MLIYNFPPREVLNVGYRNSKSIERALFGEDKKVDHGYMRKVLMLKSRKDFRIWANNLLQTTLATSSTKYSTSPISNSYSVTRASAH